MLGPGVSSNLLRLLESLLLVSRLLLLGGGPLGLLGLLEGLLVEGGLLVDNDHEDKRSLLLKKINPPAGRQAGQAAEVQAGSRLAPSWAAAAAGRQGKTSAAQPARPWSVTNGHAHRDLGAVDDDVSHLLEVLEPALLPLLRSSSCWPGLGLLLPHSDNLKQVE